MGSTERRDRERAAVRRRMLDAARRLFAAEGYAAVSMRRIADAIEYSPTAIYAHFADKDALVRELCSDDFRQFSAASADLGRVADPVERLRRLGRFYVGFAVGHPNHYKLMFMTESPAAAEPTAADLADKGNPDRDGYALLLHTTAEAMAAGRFRRRLADPRLVAQTIWAAVHGVASLQIVMGADPWVEWAPLDDRVTAAVDGILDGLLADDHARPAGPPLKETSKTGARR